MLAFVLRRLVQTVIVMVVVAFVAFLLFQYVGDPVVFLLGQDAKPEQIRQLRADLGLDRPFFVQFWHFLLNALQGEFGLSLRQGAKVSRLILERLPATLELSIVAAILALAIGLPMGVYAALRRGTFATQALMALSLLGVSLPTFLIGILLILVFSVWLGWLPSFGRGDTVDLWGWRTGLLTRDGWVKRQREIKDPSATRLREGDQVLSVIAGSTKSTVVFFSSFGTAYTCRIADVPATTGYGEPIQKLFKMKDGEAIIAMASLDPRLRSTWRSWRWCWSWWSARCCCSSAWARR